MLYLWPQCSSIENRLHSGFGLITQPQDETVPYGIRHGKRLWACDNGAYSDKFRSAKFFHHLGRLAPYRSGCLFVAVPDCYANNLATLDLYRWYAWRIQAMGFPAAYVCQDGAESFPFPPCDWIFIGGTSEWKLSPAAAGCILRAKRMGLGVHVGRVNSLYRIGYFEALGADTVDGTYPVHNPPEAEKRFNRALKYPMPRAIRLSYRAVLGRHHSGEPDHCQAGT